MADLTTVAAVKAYLPIPTGITTDDALLQTLVTAVSAAIEAYCARTFASASYTETQSGRGGCRLMLRHAPVTAVAAVTVDTTSVPARTVVTQPGFVLADTDLGLVALVGYGFARGVQNVVVQYTAGYATTPADVAQACVRWVARLYKERDRLDLTSKGAAGETTSYDVGPMPKFVQAALAPYVRQVAP